jgi:hypothetical protein
MLRNGKIACLPRPRRDELNRRLARNEDGATLLDWLNAAPDVKDRLARDFAGEPVSQQNLHEWRHGGFAEWQTRQDLFAAAADLTDANGEWDALAANDFTERLAAVLVVRYADVLAGWNGGDDEAFRLKLRDLRRFNQDLAVLRRYNQTAARLKLQQMSLSQAEKQPTQARTSGRKRSEAGARADDDRLARQQPEGGGVQMLAPAACLVSAPSMAPAPAVVAASPAINPARTATDLSVAAGRNGVINTGLPQTDRNGSSSGKEFTSQGRPNGAPVGIQPGDPGKSMSIGAATMAAALVRVNLVIKFVDSLRQASMVIEKRSSQASNLKDRRAVQEAYAGSVATVNRLGKEAGLLRANLPAFPEVDRLGAAIGALQREYLGLKSRLFQGFPTAIPAGLQQLREAACELNETLQSNAATAAPLALPVA